MKRLIELAQKIKDVELRENVVKFLKDPGLAHKDFKKYPRMKIADVRTPFVVGNQTVAVERDVLNHSIALADLCLKTVDSLDKNYGIPLNQDHMLAAAILHDIMKIFEWKKGPQGVEHTGILLDHTMLGVAELYRRKFPEGVIHIIASHFGEAGPTPPRNFEAVVFHYLDTLLSVVEYRLYAMTTPQTQMPVVLLDEKALKELIEKGVK